jgi:hypothetical protein
MKVKAIAEAAVPMQREDGDDPFEMFWICVSEVGGRR